jgi:hypothetical protein
MEACGGTPGLQAKCSIPRIFAQVQNFSRGEGTTFTVYLPDAELAK